MENIISNERCKKCAECCRNFPFVKLSMPEIRLLEQLTALDFDKFTNPQDSAVEKHFLKFKANGDCFFLDEDNGRYSCGVYKTRPGICKNYPSKPLQQAFCSKSSAKHLSNNTD